MQTPLRKYDDLRARILSALAAVGLAFATLGTFVLLPAALEARGLEVFMPHVDEAPPRIAPAGTSD